MATCGTFDYTFIVPEAPRGGTRQMEGALRQPLQGDPERLLGHAPLLQTVEYHREKWQLLCRVTLTATEKKHAIASSFSFNVDRELIAMLRGSDVLHVSADNPQATNRTAACRAQRRQSTDRATGVAASSAASRPMISSAR